jgi:16S rRNA G966 N2-methylase RsmD
MISFLDPPYKSDELCKIIPNLASSKIISTGSLVVVETDSKVMLNWPKQFKLFFSRNYGRSKIEISEKV